MLKEKRNLNFLAVSWVKHNSYTFWNCYRWKNKAWQFTVWFRVMTMAEMMTMWKMVWKLGWKIYSSVLQLKIEHKCSTKILKTNSAELFYDMFSLDPCLPEQSLSYFMPLTSLDNLSMVISSFWIFQWLQDMLKIIAAYFLLLLSHFLKLSLFSLQCLLGNTSVWSLYTFSENASQYCKD